MRTSAAVMGQSCGGAQALAESHVPRFSTTVMLNSGMGEVAMLGADKEQLKNLHAPILYVVGGDIDQATDMNLESYTKNFRGFVMRNKQIYEDRLKYMRLLEAGF